MHFKTFPREVQGSSYPRWEEIGLTDVEEKLEEQNARIENIELMKRCVDDAKKLIKDKKLKLYQSDVVSIALALFRKRASHVVYWKDTKCKEKFDRVSKGKKN